MAHKIVWSNIALEDYWRIVDYLLTNWSSSVAINFENIVNKKLGNLALQPFTGIPSEKYPSIRSILLTEHNRLFYRVRSETIELLNIFDTRQDPKKSRF